MDLIWWCLLGHTAIRAEIVAVNQGQPWGLLVLVPVEPQQVGSTPRRGGGWVGGYKRKKVSVPKMGLSFWLSIQNFIFPYRNILFRCGWAQERPFAHPPKQMTSHTS